jgi:hypothetical protein
MRKVQRRRAEARQSVESQTEPAGEAQGESARDSKDLPPIETLTENGLERQMGDRMLAGMDQANNSGHANRADPAQATGIWYPFNFEDSHPGASFDRRWLGGYTASNAFDDWWTFQEKKPFVYQLKSQHSASAAIQSWLHGLTIADCACVIVALEFETVRAAIGNEKFDQRFGSDNPAIDAAISPEHRLRISQNVRGTPIAELMKPTELNDVSQGERPPLNEEIDHYLKPGEWYFYSNHPSYLLKHPGGFWQGENCLYVGRTTGKRHWAGFGEADFTDAEILQKLVTNYNRPRDDSDEAEMKNLGVMSADGQILNPLYDPANFPDQLSGPADIVNAEDPSRGLKGGLNLNRGVTLDAHKVWAIMNSPGRPSGGSAPAPPSAPSH